MVDGPEEVTLVEMKRRLRAYAEQFHTSLIGISHLDEHHYQGGATLVMIEGVPGALTADHVWADVLGDGCAQVAFAGTSSHISPGIPVSGCHVAHRASPPRPTDDGPDLAFIRLPEPYAYDLGTSGKRFFNLTGSRRAAMRPPATAVGDPRLVFGIPEETTHTFRDESAMGPVTRMEVGTHAFTSRIVRVWESDGWDYAEFNLDGKGDDAAQTMQGMSGSGMWRVGEEPTRGRVVVDLKAITLDGVVLRWGPGEPEFLRCHGRSSIYRFHDEVVLKL